jgi:hypothetical protein
MVPVVGETDFVKRHTDSLRDYEEAVERLSKEKGQLATLQLRLDTSCKRLDIMPDEVVLSRDLGKLKEELDKLDLDINY